LSRPVNAGRQTKRNAGTGTKVVNAVKVSDSEQCGMEIKQQVGEKPRVRTTLENYVSVAGQRTNSFSLFFYSCVKFWSPKHQPTVDVGIIQPSGETIRAVALVDSWSDINLIKTKFLEKNILSNDCGVYGGVVAANGSPITTGHKTTVLFKYKNKKIQEVFLTCDQMKYDMILSFPFCYYHGLQFY
jgi:hypothetical protein